LLPYEALVVIGYSDPFEFGAEARVDQANPDKQ